MKKQLLLLGLVLGLSFQLFSQTTKDVGDILNTCVVEKNLLADLQQNSGTDLNFALESNLFDLTNYQTTFPETLNIDPVFKSKAAATVNYYEWILDFSSEKAVIVIVIKHENSANTSWTFSMEKTANEWVVKE